MDDGLLLRMRSEAEDIFRSSVVAVDPFEAVKRFVRRHGHELTLGSREAERLVLDLRHYDRILVVGAGKATAPMARALEEILGERIQPRHHHREIRLYRGSGSISRRWRQGILCPMKRVCRARRRS